MERDKEALWRGFVREKGGGAGVAQRGGGVD